MGTEAHEVIAIKGIPRIGSAALLLAGLVIGALGPSTLTSAGPVSVEAAQSAATTPTIVSGITVQNLSAATANVVINFYNPDGSQVAAAAYPFQLPASAQKTLYSPNIPNLPPGFAGSAVVSADQPVAAIFNTQTPTNAGAVTTDPDRVTTNSGIETNQLGATLYAPQVMSNYAGGWNSSLYVQNAGSAATTVTITYRDRNGAPVSGATESASIPANSTHIFQQQTNSALSSVAQPASAVISAANPTDQLASIVILANSGNDNVSAQLLSYNASAAGGTKLYAPRLVNNFYGFNSGLTIQNLDPTNSANVVVSYYFGSQTQTETLPPLAPGASTALYLPNVKVDSGQGLPSGVGSAIITSNTNITAIVNEDNRVTSSPFVGQGTTYNAFVAGTETTKVFMPQVTSCYYGYASGITIQNVGTQAGTGTLTLTASNGTSQQFAIPSLAANHTTVVYVPNDWTSGGFNGSGQITFSQPIVALHDMSFRGTPSDTCPIPAPAAGTYGDSYAMYDGLNQ